MYLSWAIKMFTTSIHKMGFFINKLKLLKTVDVILFKFIDIPLNT